MQPSTVGTKMAGGTESPVSPMSDKAHAGIERLTQSAHHTVDRIASAASSAAERVRHVGDSKYAHLAQNWKEQTCAYVRAHPMTSVGIAAAAGYLVSRLTHWR